LKEEIREATKVANRGEQKRGPQRRGQVFI